MENNTKFLNLEHQFARLIINKEANEWQSSLTIVKPEDATEHAFEPAASIFVHGLSKLKALQKFLNENLPA